MCNSSSSQQIRASKRTQYTLYTKYKIRTEKNQKGERERETERARRTRGIAATRQKGRATHFRGNIIMMHETNTNGPINASEHRIRISSPFIPCILVFGVFFSFYFSFIRRSPFLFAPFSFSVSFSVSSLSFASFVIYFY